MIKFLSKAFSVFVTVVSILILIAGPVCGYFAAKMYVYNVDDIEHPLLVTIAIMVLGLVASFIFDIVVFGFAAQIISINRNLETYKDIFIRE